jgi:hypothetical protein
MSVTREHVLSELKRLTAEGGGKAPGRRAFEVATGIRPAEWLGIHWTRWTDAVADAGLAPSAWQGKLDVEHVLGQLAAAVRHFGRVPSDPELRIYGRTHPEFPGHDTFRNHFLSKAETVSRLREWVRERPDLADILATLGPVPTAAPTRRTTAAASDGFVYLIRSGAHHKIGRNDELERRVKQIRVALPEAAMLEHSIRTDDPAGIETYWHRRFADRRANGEWFKLTPADVAAFKRRTFQ